MSACNCTTSFDLRARCYPPSSAMVCKFESYDLGWFKFRDHEDNWEHCPVRVDTAKAHFVNSPCLHDSHPLSPSTYNRTRDGGDGHNEAKWREASALIGLTEAETEAVIAMRDRDRFETSGSDYSEEVGCYCPMCDYEGTCHVPATRAKELQELGELEENFSDLSNCFCNNSDESSDEDDCDVVAEDDGSLHVVPASGLGEGDKIADYDAVSLFPSAMGELDEGKKKAMKLMLASGYGKTMGKQ